MNVQNIRGRFDCSPSIMMHSMDAFCGPINPQNFNHLCEFTQLRFYGIELASGFRVTPHAAEVIGSCRFYRIYLFEVFLLEWFAMCSKFQQCCGSRIVKLFSSRPWNAYKHPIRTASSNKHTGSTIRCRTAAP